MTNLMKGEFHSVWNGGEYDLSTDCQVDMNTCEIVSIGPPAGVGIEECLDSLDYEYICFPPATMIHYPVERERPSCVDGASPTYWYR